MAQFESILGDQKESSQPADQPTTLSQDKNKKDNVTEFNSQSAQTPMAGRDVVGSSRLSSSTVGGAATAPARSFYDQAKETAGQAYEAVTDKAATKIDEQKSTLSGGLNTVADSVRQVSNNLESSATESGLAEAAAKYTGTAAQKLEDVAGYFETHGVRDMARDLEGFARRNPAVFLGAAFGLGFLVARFLKSSPQNYNPKHARREFGAPTDTSHQLEAPASSPDFSAKPL